MKRNILIIRPSAIGDIVMASPMIRAIKSSWPDAKITWLVDPAAKDLLVHHPLLDDIIFWSKSRWRLLFRSRRLGELRREVMQLIRELRGRQFDLVLDAQGLLRSRIIAWSSGAKRRYGFVSKEPGGFLMTRIISRGPDSCKMSSEYLHMVNHLGIHPESFHPEIHLPDKVLEGAVVVKNRASISSDYAIFCPFTTRPQKHWYEDRWAVLAEILQRRFAISTVLLGGNGDIEAAGRITYMSSEKIWNMAGKTTIGEAAALIKDARIVIGVDTGLTHLGSAFDRPTVALFGATCPYVETQSPFTVVLHEPRPCSPCRRRPTCDNEFYCMQGHSAGDIADRVELLLNLSERGNASSSEVVEAV